MDETASVVQSIEKPVHRKALTIANPLIILLSLAYLVLTDEIRNVPPVDPYENMIILESPDENIPFFKGTPGMPTHARAANFFEEGR